MFTCTKIHNNSFNVYAWHGMDINGVVTFHRVYDESKRYIIMIELKKSNTECNIQYAIEIYSASLYCKHGHII